MEGLGYVHHSACPDLPSGFRAQGTAFLGNSGLILLSNRPITRAAYHRFRAQAPFEFHCVDRGALFVEVDFGNNVKVRVFTAHMASGGMVLLAGMNMSVEAQEKLTGQGNGTGAQQGRELLEFVQAQGVPTIPAEPGVVTIVAGDLNMRPAHQEYTELAAGMRRLGLTDAWQGEWEPTFGTVDENGDSDEWLMTHRADLKTEKELDYIFYSGVTLQSKSVEKCKEADRSVGWQQVSDHAGVMATFVVPIP